MELVHIAVWQQRRFRMPRIIFRMAVSYFTANIWLVVCLVRVDLVLHISVWIWRFWSLWRSKNISQMVWFGGNAIKPDHLIRLLRILRNPKSYSNVARTIFSKKPECCHSLAHRKALSVHAVFLKKMTVYIWLWIMCVEAALRIMWNGMDHFHHKIVGIYCTIRSGHCWTCIRGVLFIKMSARITWS